MNEIFTYREAKPYLQRTKRMLKSVRTLENFISSSKKDILEFSKIARKTDKKTAIISFLKKSRGNFEQEYDTYIEKTEASIARAEHLYHKITHAIQNIPNDTVREILQYYYIEEHTIEDTADHFAFSLSSISRYKKAGLVKITESLFGIIIDDKVPSLLQASML